MSSGSNRKKKKGWGGPPNWEEQSGKGQNIGERKGKTGNIGRG